MHRRLARIEMLLVDVDGVLTDGRITYTDRGEEIKAFHVRDGSGIKLWLRAGKRAGILTGRSSPIVARRAQELGITVVVQGADDKASAFNTLVEANGLTAEKVAYVGDDLPDLPVFAQCGWAAAVADACREARRAAHYVTRTLGGHGAVREVIELILRSQGRWPR